LAVAGSLTGLEPAAPKALCRVSAPFDVDDPEQPTSRAQRGPERSRSRSILTISAFVPLSEAAFVQFRQKRCRSVKRDAHRFAFDAHRFAFDAHRFAFDAHRFAFDAHRFAFDAHRFAFDAHRFAFDAHRFAFDAHRFAFDAHRFAFDAHRFAFDAHHFAFDAHRFAFDVHRSGIPTHDMLVHAHLGTCQQLNRG
jgi:hypothetical protein